MDRTDLLLDSRWNSAVTPTAYSAKELALNKVRLAAVTGMGRRSVWEIAATQFQPVSQRKGKGEDGD
jgi:hypothetical protein